jgi:small-conductance mechanosensitive channel
MSVSSDIRSRIFEALKHAGIEIPFPQRDLHLKSGIVAVPPADDDGAA